MHRDHDIAIVGGGAAGTLAAIHLLRQARPGLRIAIYEPAPRPGEGVAYSTRRPEHLLNVPAGKMSALPEEPADFLHWLAGRAEYAGAGDLSGRYLPRRDYAAYLGQRLEEARASSPATLELHRHRITALQRRDGGLRLQWDGGSAGAARVLLATGNALRPLPARGAGALAAPQLLQAWDSEGLAAIAAQARVCIVGTGLSMVDVVLTLEAGGHRGPVHLLSRHGLLPLAHVPDSPVDAGLDVDALLALGLRARLRALRQRVAAAAAAGLPWQAVMEHLRPQVQALWRSLDAADQRRFLRHVVRYWDIHRHRIAPEAGAVLRQLAGSGRLQLHRARLDRVAAAPRCVQVGARDRHGRELVLDVDHVVNATGVELRVQAMRNPLLEQLLGEGLAMPGAHGIGLATDADGRLLDAAGQARGELRVIGSLRIGEAWESLAVPELRVQARDVARAWADLPA
ncbi:pyridine nucleotide-disulfide oxidoreductase [Pseudoxanthomonas sp. SGD-10]|nr:pyridine nucleotide-disulfide oxidoreductase [Pseudoxanthomonas sp. SGD-10]